MMTRATAPLPACIAAATLAVFAPSAVRADVVAYDMSVIQATSGLNANTVMSFSSAGTLRGNYDAGTNPSGTRTKPGLSGPFEDSENVAVPTFAGSEGGGPLVTNASGGFRLTLDPSVGSIVTSNLSSNLLASGSVPLPASFQIRSDAFRTRSPDSSYSGDTALPQPLYQLSLTQLTITQIGVSDAGSLVPTAVPGKYTFIVTPLVAVSATFSAFGQSFTTTSSTTLALPLTGTIILNGSSAALSSLQPVDLTSDTQPGTPLPTLAIDVPTVDPDGYTAHLLLDLTVSDISIAVYAGNLAVNATGSLVPAPGAAAIGLLSTGILAARRRR